jgi:hypothetical protein
MPADERATPECIGYVNAWVMTELARLNRDILARRRPAGDLAAELARSVLPGLPLPEAMTAHQAQQLVVLLGLAGASVSRHYQEADRARMPPRNAPSASAWPGPRRCRSSTTSAGWRSVPARATARGIPMPA